MAKSQYYDVSPDTMFQVGDEGKDNYRAGERETLVLPHSIFLSNITAVGSLGQTVTWIAQYHTQKTMIGPLLAQCNINFYIQSALLPLCLGS